MPFVLQQPARAETAPYVFYKDFFSAEECQKIIDFSKVTEPQKAAVGGVQGNLEPEKRISEIFWLQWSPDTNWIFEKLAPNIAQANQKWWGYNLAGFNEPLQLTRYKSEENGHYDWHEDHGDSGMFLHRKISITVSLNDGYEGGNFELFHLGKVPEVTKGSMILFPSFKVHRVTPVTKNERWSLVSWVNGPPFA